MQTAVTIAKIFALPILILYFILRNKSKKEIAPSPAYLRELADFKRNAESVDVEFDFCEFKDSSFLSEVEADMSDYKTAARLVAPSLIISSPLVREETNQSVIFFKNAAVRNGQRFYQTFPVDSATLKYYVVTKRMKLFIDKSDRDKYLFEVATENG